MSFFNKLFGGEKKEAKPAPKPVPTEKDKAIQLEAAVNNLDIKIEQFEDKERKFEHKIETLKAKAKDLIAADKKKEAKRYVEEATRVQKQMEVT